MNASTTTPDPRTLTELDHVRLQRLVQRHRHGGVPAATLAPIAELLDVAQLVPSTQVDPDVVTMNSRCEVLDLETGQRLTLTVCYPQDIDPGRGCVSALSPVGASLLGLRLGEVARLSTPKGEARTVRVVGLPFQPEASGDYTL